MKNTLLVLSMVALLAACQPKPTSQEQVVETETEEFVSEPLPLTKLWETDTLLKTPESVLYSASDSILYISCINGVPPNAKDGDGFIAKISAEDGSIVDLNWVTGIDAPKGMGISGGNLYVTNIDEVVEIELATGTILNRYPVEGAQFLNDITVAEDGSVFISDSNTNRIHQLVSGQVIEYTGGDLGGSNGLLHQGDKIMVASFGSGDFSAIQTSDLSRTVLTDSIMGGDGIVAVGSDYLVSNWNGEVYYVSSTGDKEKILDTKGTANAADIEYIAGSKTLLVPTFFANTVVAYTLNK